MLFSPHACGDDGCGPAHCSRQYEMQAEFAMGTVDSSGTLTLTMTLDGVSASCSFAGNNGQLSGSCSASSLPTCSAKAMCVDGACLNGLPVPVPGANGFPSAGGNWRVTGGTCTHIPGFSSSFALSQCGSSLLVVPEGMVRASVLMSGCECGWRRMIAVGRAIVLRALSVICRRCNEL